MGHMLAKEGSNIVKIQPIKVDFHPNLNEVDIIVQVLNRELFNLGGILKSVEFGAKDAVNQYMFSNEVIQIVTVSINFCIFYMAQFCI